MKTSRIVHFQVAPGNILWVLDADGVLWRNMDPPRSDGWESVPGPTLKQHRLEDAASADRERFDISIK